MAAFFQRILAFFMTLLAFFGLGEKIRKPDPGTAAEQTARYVIEGQSVKFTFVSNPSTGYCWQTECIGDALEQTEDTYVSKDVSVPGGPALAGAPGEQIYGYRAVKPGRVTIVFTYLRPWESEPPAERYVAEIAVAEDLTVTVESFVSQK